MAKVAGQHAEKVRTHASGMAVWLLLLSSHVLARQAKTTVRNARKAALDQLKKVKSVSEDDVFRYQKQVRQGVLIARTTWH